MSVEEFIDELNTRLQGACSVTDEGRDVAATVADLIESKAVTQSLFEENDLRVIGEGQERIAAIPTRDGLIDGDCVFKFERDRPPDQNIGEFSNWEAAPQGVRQVLAPVSEIGPEGRWLVMPRAEELGDPVGLVVVETVLENNNWSCRGLTTENIGVFDGDPKAIDYGMQCWESGDPIRQSL